MNKDESVEKTLREAGMFPPSVQDSHYGDKPEMTREEIIEKTLREMNLSSSSEEGSQSSDEAGRLSTVIAELGRRLPDGNIKTCGAFRHLNTGCCDSDRDVDYHNHSRPCRKPRIVSPWHTVLFCRPQMKLTGGKPTYHSQSIISAERPDRQ